MNPNTSTVLGWFSLVVVAEATALYAVKKYSLTETPIYLGLSVVCYGLIPILLYCIMKHQHNIATVNITWNILSTMYGLAIGILLFQERIGNLQWAGIVLGSMGLVFLFWKS